MRTSLFAFALLATTACSGKSAGDDTEPRDGDPPPPTVCYPATGVNAEAVPECGATEVCLPEDGGIAIDDASCVQPYCRWQYATTLLNYNDDESASVELNFHSSISGATTTEQLVAAFDHVKFSARYPIVPAMPVVDTAAYYETRTGIEAFDAFELSDGRLHVRLVFNFTSLSTTVSSSDPSCVLGDVGGTCLCVFESVAREGSIDIDLPAEIW